MFELWIEKSAYLVVLEIPPAAFALFLPGDFFAALEEVVCALIPDLPVSEV